MVQDPPIRGEKVVIPKDEIVKINVYLRNHQPQLDIISIIGMPGLGKTTLAWNIYNDEKIRYEFPIRIWVNMSQMINIKYILIQIMIHFTWNSDELYSLDNRELCDKVRECLSRDKFLLVIDDVWKTEHWDELKSALPLQNANGKVMITSRDINVGNYVKIFTVPHQQRRLDRDESWDLLQLEVFGKVGNCPDVLKDMGRVIAEKCDGIPMTIVVLGGVLKDQYLSLKSDVLVKEKWWEVSRNVNQALADGNQVIIDIVSLSYIRLPDRLRDCFLYLGVFPSGYVISTWTLMHLWIAEGFIHPDGNRSLEKIAEDNLNDLINRNLLLVHKRNQMGEVKVCIVQDVIRKFCISEAEKQNMFREIKMEEEGAGVSANKMEIRRLCLHSDLNKFFSKKLQRPRVRSFLCFQKDVVDLMPANVPSMYEQFLSLRILHSQSIKIKNIHPKLFKLIHLRYIVLSVPDLAVLPEQISQLWNLQTIVLHTNSNSVTMKANLWKMMRLRHVKTKAAIVLEKKIAEGDQASENLQTLNRLSPKSVPEVSQRAINLKTLGVRGDLAPLFDDMSLEKLGSLEKLKLYHDRVSSENAPRRFPECNRFPPHLKRLTLSKTFLDWKHMSTLANIPDLKVLKLKEDAFTGIQWDASSDVFKKLELLIIIYADLILWEAVPNTYPCLRHLELKNCENLKEIPECVLQSIESLDIGRVRKSIVDTAKNLAIKLKLGAELI